VPGVDGNFERPFCCSRVTYSLQIDAEIAACERRWTAFSALLHERVDCATYVTGRSIDNPSNELRRDALVSDTQLKRPSFRVEDQQDSVSYLSCTLDQRRAQTTNHEP